MQQCRIVGDIHSYKPSLSFADNDKTTIFLGDFNIYGYKKWVSDVTITNKKIKRTNKFGEEYWETVEVYNYTFEDYEMEFPVCFIDGNHDHHPSLFQDKQTIYSVAKNIYHIPRGFVSGNVLFIGGANSIDKQDRKEFIDWWKEESISYQQENRVFDIDKQIDVVITHDAPLDYVKTIVKHIYKDHYNQTFLQEVFDRFKPKLWIHGHFHRYVDKVFEGCRFVGLEQNQAIDISLPIEVIDFPF